MTNGRNERSPASEQITFGTIYHYIGRRVYLFLLFIFGVLFLLLLLLARQNGELNFTQQQLVRSYELASTRGTGRATTSNSSDTTFVTEQALDTINMLTVDNYSLYLDGLFVRPPDQPAAGDIDGSYDDGFTINNDAVALGTDTVGNYLQSIVTGNGLAGGAAGEGATATLTVQAGDGITVDNAGVHIALQNGGGLSTTNGLSLLDSCVDGQLLKWIATSSSWGCANDTAGGGALQVRESDDSPSVNPVAVLELGPATSSSDEFVITDQGGGVVRLRTGTAVPLANAAATIAGAWAFNSEMAANGGIACNSCIALGSETSGNYLAGLLAGSGLQVTGASGEGATPTVSLDSSLVSFRTVDASLGTDPVADSLTDSLTLSSGDGVSVTGSAAADSVSFSANLTAGGGLVIAGGGISLLNTCASGEHLEWSGSTWACAPAPTLPNLFQNIAGDSGTATADSTADTLTLVGGDGIITTAASTPDAVTLDVNVAAGSGLTFSGGALSLLSCSDGQLLKRVAGAWACANDDDLPAMAYQQQLTGTDNVTVGSSLTPLLTNGSGTAQSLPITITSGNDVMFVATAEVSSSLVTGPLTYVIIRDDNADNDCATGGGDGTQVGGQTTSFIATVAQSFTTTMSFADTSPGGTTVRYQLCASTTIALGTTTITDRSLRLEEASF